MKKIFSFVLTMALLVALMSTMGCQTKEVTSAKVYISQNNWDKAIEQLEQAVQIYPNDAEARYLLGEGYGNKGLWEKMNEMFNQSTALAPTFATQIKNTREKYWVNVFNQGVAKVNAKEGETADLEGAAKFFSDAVRIDPSHIESYKNLAYAHLRSNNLPAAIKAYQDYLAINPKGYVPVLELDNGERLSEGPAIVQYIADLKPELGLAPAAGSFERYRLQEWLAFINSEVHKGFSPLFNPATPEETKAATRAALAGRLAYLAGHLDRNEYLLGTQFTVADGYLYTVLNWGQWVGVDISQWPSLAAFVERVASRPSVSAARAAEAGKG